MIISFTFLKSPFQLALCYLLRKIVWPTVGKWYWPHRVNLKIQRPVSPFSINPRMFLETSILRCDECIDQMLRKVLY